MCALELTSMSTASFCFSADADIPELVVYMRVCACVCACMHVCTCMCVHFIQ